jgi:hypothetical protein
MSDGRPYEEAPHVEEMIAHWDFDDDQLDCSRVWPIDENGNIHPFVREYDNGNSRR